MSKSAIKEIYYLIISFIILFLFILFYGLAFSLQELSFRLSYTKMSNNQSLVYFWFILIFIITFSRQLKLKFRSYYPNLILIIIGILLIVYFNIFSLNTNSYELTIKENEMVYKVENYTTAYIIFRILQLLLIIVIIKSSINLFRKEATL